jgi:hypothetical protein
MTDLTQIENESVKILVRLGDSKELAIKTVVAYRPNEAMKRAQVLNLK